MLGPTTAITMQEIFHSIIDAMAKVKYIACMTEPQFCMYLCDSVRKIATVHKVRVKCVISEKRVPSLHAILY